MFKTKLSIILLIVVSALFIVGFTKFSNIVEAADPGTFDCTAVSVTRTLADGTLVFDHYDVSNGKCSNSCTGDGVPDSSITSQSYGLWNPGSVYTDANPPGPLPSGASCSKLGGNWENMNCIFNCKSANVAGTVSRGGACNPLSNPGDCATGLSCGGSDTPSTICILQGTIQDGSPCYSKDECSNGACIDNGSGNKTCGGTTTTPPVNPGDKPNLISGQGNSCQPNYSSCTADTKNLMASINNNTLTLSSDLISPSIISSEFGAENSNKLCITKSATQLIHIFKGFGSDNPNDVTLPNGDLAKVILMRSCASGYTANSQHPPGARDLGTIWGCCPANYTYVIPDNGDTDYIIQDSGVCCPTNKSAYPTHTKFAVGAAQKCYDSSDNPINDAVAIDNDQDPKILGVPLAGEITIDKAAKGSDLKCDNADDCVVVSGSPSGSVPLDAHNSVTLAGNLTTQTGLQCLKCYGANEAIGIVNDSSGGQRLAVCDKASLSQNPPVLKTIALVNNSIADTLATLTTDPTNAAALAKCRAQGGIYTAIGCVDTTPTGIITGLIRIALGVVGGVALLEIILVGIQYQRGNDDEIKKARDRLIATLSGLAVLIFSVLILRILGVNVLNILPAGSVLITRILGL